MEWEEADLNDLCELLGYFVVNLGSECLEGGNPIENIIQNIQHAVDCGIEVIKVMQMERMGDSSWKEEFLLWQLRENE